MNYKILAAPILAALLFTACDKAQQERKNAAEDHADALHNAADATRDEAKSDAHATKAAGEETAKAIENKADVTRDAAKADAHATKAAGEDAAKAIDQKADAIEKQN